MQEEHADRQEHSEQLGAFPGLTLGAKIRLRVPVVLAPMAGVTNAPYRMLCRGFGEALYVSEMISARAFCHGNEKTRLLASFHPSESPRSLQLHASTPAFLEEATRILVGEGAVDHLDLNLGCPVRKITSSGGGSAIPYRKGLLRRLLAGFKRGAGDTPVTVKMRLGIDDAHHTYLEAGRIAEAEGMAWVGLHARTAAQLYDGQADWEHIGRLQENLSIPVLGNGDIWEAEDALRMVKQCACRGVIIGRACLGRPWLFRELEAAFLGREIPAPPNSGEIREIALEHFHLLEDYFDTRTAALHLRKFASWYTQGFTGAKALKADFQRITNVEELRAVLARLDPNMPFPAHAARSRRCKKGGVQKVALPPEYLDHPELETSPEEERLLSRGELRHLPSI